MGLIEEVTKMQQQGMSSQDISMTLQQQGVDRKKIAEVLSQTAIKNAVASREESPATISEYSQDSGMEQSVMNNNYQDQNNAQRMPQAEPVHEEEHNYVDYSQFSTSGQKEQQYTQGQNYSEQSYQNYNSTPQSSDNVSEIAEQIFDEKISSLSRKMETILDSKTEIEAKVESIDVRLKKIEKIIDRLQLSVLQKVGEYMTNVEDIKKEMVETQKSFKYLLKDKSSN